MPLWAQVHTHPLCPASGGSSTPTHPPCQRRALEGAGVWRAEPCRLCIKQDNGEGNSTASSAQGAPKLPWRVAGTEPKGTISEGAAPTQTFPDMLSLFTLALALAGELLFTLPGPPPVPLTGELAVLATHSMPQPQPMEEGRPGCPRCALQDAGSWNTLVYPVPRLLSPG